jgi:hypothetical protein
VRLDRNYSFREEGWCPDCKETGRRPRWAFLSTPSEGRTDIVRCWRCKYEGPRFIEIPDDPPKKKKRRGGIRPRRKQMEPGDKDWRHPRGGDY